QLHFRLDLDPTVTDVYLDVAKLKQIFLNLLSNAIKFTPEGGSVTVRVSPHGEDAFTAEIEDTGIGIHPADLPRLFTAFQQLDSSMAKTYQGTGLGLALTKHLVEAQGGQISVRSVPGQGSIFTFTLPRHIEDEQESASEAHATKGGNVLILDAPPENKNREGG